MLGYDCVAVRRRYHRRGSARGTTWQPWPEKSLIKLGDTNAWTVLPLLHTLPSNDVANSVWVQEFVSALPITTAVLRSVPNIRTALISRMKPLTLLAPHSGYADMANHVLRVHVPLTLPPPDDDGRPCTGVVVEGAVQYHQKNTPLVFDDSRVHYAFNKHRETERTVLLFDVARPAHVAPGSSTVVATKELLDLMDYFN